MDQAWQIWINLFTAMLRIEISWSMLRALIIFDRAFLKSSRDLIGKLYNILDDYYNNQ